jgi:hypothetical protein
MTGTYKLHLITSTAQLNPKTRRPAPSFNPLSERTRHTSHEESLVKKKL